MSQQAVYDVLRALTDAGLVRRIHPPGSVARYESRVGDNHHHLVCRSCGAIADVDCAVGTAPCLTAADDHGYAIDEAEVIYWGLCPECSTAAFRFHPLIPERVPVSEQPDAVVGEMNEPRTRAAARSGPTAPRTRPRAAATAAGGPTG